MPLFTFILGVETRDITVSVSDTQLFTTLLVSAGLVLLGASATSCKCSALDTMKYGATWFAPGWKFHSSQGGNAPSPHQRFEKKIIRRTIQISI